MSKIKKFLKPTKGKIVLAIILGFLFVYLGGIHILAGKHTPLSGISAPIYSSVITIITLWPLAIFFLPIGLISLQSTVVFYCLIGIQNIAAFLILGLYYYFLSCLWFYKKDVWKIKNYLLLVTVVVMIILSILAAHNSNKTNCLGLNENDCRLKENCVPAFSTQRIYEAVGSKNYESIVVFLQCEYIQEKYKSCEEVYRSSVKDAPEECIIE